MRSKQHVITQIEYSANGTVATKRYDVAEYFTTEANERI